MQLENAKATIARKGQTEGEFSRNGKGGSHRGRGGGGGRGNRGSTRDAPKGVKRKRDEVEPEGAVGAGERGQTVPIIKKAKKDGGE